MLFTWQNFPTQRRDLWSPTFTPLEEAAIQENMSILKVALDEVIQVWKANDMEPELQEGRILCVINNSGATLDWSYHILPLPYTPGITKPDLFSDEIFESWWKTTEVWKEFVRANDNLSAFATQYAPAPPKKADGKAPSGTLEALGATSEQVDNANLVEWVVAVTSEGELSWCMACVYHELGLPLLTRTQNRVILETLNRFNSASATAMRKRESGRDYRPKRDLRGFLLTPVVICPLYFQFLDWSAENNKIPQRHCIKKKKFGMSMALPYLQSLHEHAMSPLNLGLRALMCPPQPALTNSKLKG